MDEKPVSKHSVKLSTQYRTAIRITRKIILEKQSLHNLLFNEKHARKGNLQALLDKLFRNRELIENVIEKSKILVSVPRLCPFACRVLVTELLLGRANGLKGEAKPILTVLSYKDKLLEIFQEAQETISLKEKVITPRFVRINTLIISLQEALDECYRLGFQRKEVKFSDYAAFLETIKNLDEYDFVFDFHIKNLLVFSHTVKHFWAMHQLVEEHKFILQDRASCLAPFLLELPESGACVLDLCAAPGMKTSYMAAKMRNKGIIYANDYSKDRYQTLCENLKNKNVKNVTPINRDGMEITSEDYPNVEYILIDPSCSGSGMKSRVGDTTSNDQRIRQLARLQTKLLVETLQKFPNVKRVVYSTCSIFKEENEQVVEKALQRCPRFELLDPRLIVGDSWINFGRKEYQGGENCLYCYENVDLTNGFFCAIFENRGEEVAADLESKVVENGKNVTSEFSTEIKELSEAISEDIETESRKVKKRKKKLLEAIEKNVDRQLPEESIDSELTMVKKKHKKTVSDDPVPDDIEVVFDKKKKKQRKLLEDLEENRDLGEELIDSESTTNKKKRKKTDSDDPVQDDVKVLSDKKKKKKRKLLEDLDENRDLGEELIDSESTTKKKKHKKAKESIAVSTTVFITLDASSSVIKTVVETAIPKKIKKPKKNEAVLLTAEEDCNEIVSNKTKKSNKHFLD